MGHGARHHVNGAVGLTWRAARTALPQRRTAISTSSHEGACDPWLYVNYVLFVLKTAYRDFEERAGHVKTPRGTKTARVGSANAGFPGDFTLPIWSVLARCMGHSSSPSL
jgi:hypothetical protein